MRTLPSADIVAYTVERNRIVVLVALCLGRHCGVILVASIYVVSEIMLDMLEAFTCRRAVMLQLKPCELASFIPT
jgi:hypothetical protein